MYNIEGLTIEVTVNDKVIRYDNFFESLSVYDFGDLNNILKDLVLDALTFIEDDVYDKCCPSLYEDIDKYSTL